MGVLTALFRALCGSRKVPGCQKNPPSLRVVKAVFLWKLVSRPGWIFRPSVDGVRQRGIIAPVRIGGFYQLPPLDPFRINPPPRINGARNRPPFSAIMALGEGRLARRLAMIPPGADGNRGQPRST